MARSISLLLSLALAALASCADARTSPSDVGPWNSNRFLLEVLSGAPKITVQKKPAVNFKAVFNMAHAWRQVQMKNQVEVARNLLEAQEQQATPQAKRMLRQSSTGQEQHKAHTTRLLRQRSAASSRRSVLLRGGAVVNQVPALQSTHEPRRMLASNGVGRSFREQVMAAHAHRDGLMMQAQSADAPHRRGLGSEAEWSFKERFNTAHAQRDGLVMHEQEGAN